ncbi:MAG TPA: RNB domain-containing ribonuclease [Actinomycetes bacterium]|nr:RNB domain-containing ribonuclease [Actinomycetes bacterium]
MPRRLLRLRADGGLLRARFAAIRDELGVPDGFSSPVLAEAEAATSAAAGVSGVPGGPAAPEDRTDLPLLTIDPPGSMDLDQALHLQRHGRGYRVHYAIADVATFVRPGGAIDAEAHRRAETIYAPDERAPLHPPALSEGAASLLPGQVRPAVLWTIDLDADGELIGADLRRALVRSRQRWDYEAVQRGVDAGDERWALLGEIGRLRLAREVERGGVDLPIPEQEVVPSGAGFALAYRTVVPAERWNAQISLLTGIAAARLMVAGRVGVLRTLPAAPNGRTELLRRTASALGIDWPAGDTFAELVHSLDPARPEVAAFVQEATSLLRGAGYVSFDGELPPEHEHAAVASVYAHVTAPLRRLVDRYATECCLALVEGRDVPEWVRARLAELPKTMAVGDQLAARLERACLDAVEAAVLAGAVGRVFPAVVVEVREGGGVVQLREPAVRARCDGEALPLGELVDARLVEADVQTGTVRFALA